MRNFVLVIRSSCTEIQLRALLVRQANVALTTDSMSPEAIQRGPGSISKSYTTRKEGNVQPRRGIMRQQQPIPHNTLRKDIQHGEEDRLSIDAELECQGTSRERTKSISTPYTQPGRGRTYIGNKANITRVDPEYAPKKRRSCASLFCAARCAWNPAWCNTIKYPTQDSVNQAHLALVCPAKVPRTPAASIT